MIKQVKRPLSGRRILVTRSRRQAADLCDRLAHLGAIPISFPVIQFEPLPTDPLTAILNQIDQYDWLIFTSGNAVNFFLETVTASRHKQAASEAKPTTIRGGLAIDRWQRPAQLRIAAIGSATARLLAEKGIMVDFIPEEFVGESLVAGLGDLMGKQVLLPRAKIGRPQIVDLLRQQGAIVADIPLYDTVTAVPEPSALAELEKGVDLLTFTSPSSVRNFLKITTAYAGMENLRHRPLFCIGPITAQEAQKQGLTVTAVAAEYTIEGLIQSIVDYVNKN